MASLIDELYPEDTHTRRMWLKYDEINADTPKEDRARIIREMKEMQLSDEKERGAEANFDASVFWGVLGSEHKDFGEWNDAEDCYRRQIEFIMKSGSPEDPFTLANSSRTISNLLTVMGLNIVKTGKPYLDEMKEIWETGYALIEKGWDDEILLDMDDLYWLVRRKEFFMAGISTALTRKDDDSALKLLDEFLSSNADIPSDDEWCETYEEVLHLAILELRLSEEHQKMDELIDGIKWLDDNSKSLVAYKGNIDYNEIFHLVYFYTVAGDIWRKMGNKDKANDLWTAGLEISKELYREGEDLTYDGLKAHIGLFRVIADKHREDGMHKESYELELEIEKMLSAMKPHIKDNDIIGERVSNGMYLGSYSEDLKEYDRMLSYWTEALMNLLDADGDSEWAGNVFVVLSEHWKNAEDREYDPEKLKVFKEVLEKARARFE